METALEDPLLQGSWVEVSPDGLELPTLSCAPCGDMEAVLLEAQMEAERGDGRPLLPLEAPAAEDLSLGEREDLEAPVVRMAGLAWPWPTTPEHLPSKKSVCIPPSLAVSALHRRRGLRDPQLLFLVIPSLLVSHVLALGLGICIGKRLATSSASSL